MRHTHEIHKAGLRTGKDDLVGAPAQVDESGDDDRDQGPKIAAQSMRNIAAEFDGGARESSSFREHLQPRKMGQRAT